MSIKTKNLIFSTIAVLFSVMVIAVVVKAATGGLLTPPSSAFLNNVPVATMHTLDDVYNQVTPVLVWQTYDGFCSETTSQPCRYDSDCPNYSGDGEICSVLVLCQNASVSQCSAGNGLIQLNSTLLGAAEYCNYLEQDGSTLSTTSQNIWRLPTIQELTQGLAETNLISMDGGGFNMNCGNYWSSTQCAAAGSVCSLGQTLAANTSFTDSYYAGAADACVRCVRNNLPATPTTAVCGDGIVETGEACDTGTLNNPGCVSCQITSGYTCNGSPSVCKRSNGQSCTSNAQCLYSNCNTDTGICGDIGSGCGANSNCFSNYCDTFNGGCTTGELNASCGLNTSCSTNWCNTFNHICSTGELNTTCGANNNCSTSWCDTRNHVCTAGGVGATCGANGNCSTHYCDQYNHACTTGGVGAGCSTNNNCSSGFCDTRSHACTTGDVGATCGAFYNCASGHCDTLNHTCTTGENGQSCGAGGYSGDCISGFCNSKHICGYLANGQSCGANIDCTSIFCNSNNICTDYTDGSNCNQGSDCLVGHYCNVSTNICMDSGGGAGLTCVSSPDKECFSSNFKWGTCTDSPTTLCNVNADCLPSGGTCAPVVAISAFLSTTGTWAEALTDCSSLTTGGYTWQLPAVGEMIQGITNQNATPQTVSVLSFNGNYWTSTQSGTGAYMVQKYLASPFIFAKTSTLVVSCVHD